VRIYLFDKNAAVVKRQKRTSTAGIGHDMISRRYVTANCVFPMSFKPSGEKCWDVTVSLTVRLSDVE
jgi:hypothetical protein